MYIYIHIYTYIYIYDISSLRVNDDGRKRTRYILVIARSLPTLEVLCIELESRKRSSGVGSEKMERVGEG